jgi:hypothetical protein
VSVYLAAELSNVIGSRFLVKRNLLRGVGCVEYTCSTLGLLVHSAKRVPTAFVVKGVRCFQQRAPYFFIRIEYHKPLCVYRAAAHFHTHNTDGFAGLNVSAVFFCSITRRRPQLKKFEYSNQDQCAILAQSFLLGFLCGTTHGCDFGSPSRFSHVICEPPRARLARSIFF